MMLSEYCPMGVVARSCKKTKDVLTVKKVNMYLETLKAKSTEYQDIFCRSTIYNSSANCLINNLDELSEAGINIFRLDFTHETPELIEKITKSFIDVIENDFVADAKITRSL